MKRIISIFLAITLCLSCCPSAFASNLDAFGLAKTSQNVDMCYKAFLDEEIDAETDNDIGDITGLKSFDLSGEQIEDYNSMNTSYPKEVMIENDNSSIQEDLNYSERIITEVDNGLLQKYDEEEINTAYEQVCTYLTGTGVPYELSLETFIREYDDGDYDSLDSYCNTFYDLVQDNRVSLASDEENKTWFYNTGYTLYHEPNYNKYNLLNIVKPGDIIYEAQGGGGITGHIAIVEAIKYNSRYGQFYISIIEVISEASGSIGGDGVCRGVLDDDRYDIKDAHILRVKNASDTIKQNAVNFCANQIGKDYMLDFQKDTSSTEADWYCSELVWAAYKNQDIELETELGEPGVTPRDLNASSKVSHIEAKEGGTPDTISANVNSQTSVRISWDKMPNASKYYVYTSTTLDTTDASHTKDTRYVTANTSYLNSGLKSGSTYYYRVAGYTSAIGSASRLLAARLYFGAPVFTYYACPDAGSSKIEWSPVYDATGYYVYRSTETSADSFVQIADVKNCSYVDTNLNTGITYYYKVAAYNATKSTGKSGYVKLRPVAVETPVIYYRKACNLLQNKLKWTNVPGATGYHVFRSTSETGDYVEIGSTKNKTTYFDYGNLVAGTTYYYKICASVDGIYGDLSGSKSITSKK